MTMLVQWTGPSKRLEISITGRQVEWLPGQIQDTPVDVAATLIEAGAGWVPTDEVRPFVFDAYGQVVGLRLRGGEVQPLGGMPGALSEYTRPTTLASAIAQELARQTIQEAIWRARVTELLAENPPIGNIGTVTYVDRTAAVNGNGASHLTPTNVMPTLTAGNTFLFADSLYHPGTITWPAIGRAVVGTYDRTTGARVYDKNRIAWLDGQGAQRVISTNTANDSQAGVISGLGIRGARHATDARGIYIGKATAATTTSGWIVEHCVIEDILPSATDGSALSMGIESYADDAIFRFNTIRVKNADGLYSAAAGNVGGRNPKIYGNDIEVDPTSTDDGVDCIQLFNGGTGGLGEFHVHTNRCRNTVNVKQTIIVQDTASVATTKGIVERNFCVGADMTRPALGVGGVGQKGILVDAHQTIVRDNYSSGSAFPVFVSKPNCDVYDNVLALWGAAGSEQSAYRACVAAYSNGTRIRDNVLFIDAPQGDIANNYGVHEHGTTGCEVVGNIVVGRGKGLHVSDGATLEEGNTVFVTGLARETSVGGMHPNVAKALGLRSTSTYDPGLSIDGRPRRSSATGELPGGPGASAPVALPYAFVGTWAQLQAAYPNGGRALRALRRGTKAFVTNWGVDFTPDAAGARWVAQPFTLAAGGSAYAAPIGTLSANGMFVQAPVPAALLGAGSHIELVMRTKRTGSAAVINQGIWLGTAGTTGDSRLLALQVNAANGQEHRLPRISVCCVAGNTVSTSDWASDGQQAPNIGSDRSTNINYAADMTLSWGISSITSPDTISLIEYAARVRP